MRKRLAILMFAMAAGVSSLGAQSTGGQAAAGPSATGTQAVGEQAAAGMSAPGTQAAMTTRVDYLRLEELDALYAATFGIEPVNVESASFSEVWAYLMRGEEAYLSGASPISDLCYFSAEINSYGELVGIPDARKLSSFAGRKHLVVAEIGNYSLTHFCLDPAFRLRDALVAQILEAAAPYDGVQIDFEAIPSRDRDNFVEFMRLLKAGLRAKTLSVALPARLSESGDALGYARLAAIVDRVIVMAYDEHWSTSSPGPVASMDWSERVAAFAVSKIGAEKLVLGLPFYGRAWGDKRTDRAYKYSGIESLIEEKGVGAFFREREIPWFQYEEHVIVKVFYDDAESTLFRLRLYQRAGAKSVAFWRLGQEDPEIWKRLRSGK